MKNLFIVASLCVLSVAAQAAIPNAVTVTEIQAKKVEAPEFEQAYTNLNSLEGRFAESWTQQQKLRAATQRGGSAKRKVRR